MPLWSGFIGHKVVALFPLTPEQARQPRGRDARGLTVLGRGEFSLILATLAAGAGLDRRIGPFVALYVLILAVAGPILAGRSARLARLLPARLFPASPDRAATGGRSPG
jgi:Kef-type K+ transport system membrane component KefB